MAAPASQPLPDVRDLRGRLLSGESLLGLFVKLAATEVLDLAHDAGFDFVLIDLEHSQLAEAQARTLARYALALGLGAVVRIPEVDRGAVNRLLEAGARGIQLSTVRSVRDVRALSAATRYAPYGRRSISLAHPAAAYGAHGLTAYLQEQRRLQPLLVGQIETAETEDTLAEICGAGLDVAFIGVTDLSVDMGAPGDLGNASVRQRIAAINEAARGASITRGIFANTPAAAAAAQREGARYVALSSDLAVLRAALARLPRAVEEARDASDASHPVAD